MTHTKMKFNFMRDDLNKLRENNSHDIYFDIASGLLAMMNEQT